MSGKKNTPNPWLEGLDELVSKDVVYQKAYRAAKPIRFSKSHPLEERLRLVSETLRQVYVPTERACDVMVMWIERMAAFLSHRYPDAKSYLASVYSDSQPSQQSSFICLTGPAGVGKSAVVDALQRVLPAPRTVTLDRAHRDVPIQLLRRIQVGGSDTDTMVLRSVANPSYAFQKHGLNQASAIEHLKAWFYVTGTGLLVVDEMQFLTQSTTANTRVAKLLMALGYPGVPVTFIANYSLGHRLKTRPHEERQRILSEPIVIEPERDVPLSWQTLIQEYVNACPSLLKLNETRDAEELYRLTAGLPRVLLQLILAALRQFGREKRAIINLDTLRYTYRSRAFDTQRNDVELLLALRESSRTPTRRRDLICPFSGIDPERRSAEGMHGETTNAPSSDVVVPLSAQHMLESALSPAAKKTLDELRLSKAKVHKKKKRSASIASIDPKSRLSEADLYAGADAVRQLDVRKKRRPSKGEDDA